MDGRGRAMQEQLPRATQEAKAEASILMLLARDSGIRQNDDNFLRQACMRLADKKQNIRLLKVV